MEHATGMKSPAMDEPLQPLSELLPQGEAEQLENVVRLCLFSRAGNAFALELHDVAEVLRISEVTPVPGTPCVIAGVANLRGIIVPLVDLRVLLGQPADQGEPQFAVVIRHQGHCVGLLVDEMPEIRAVPDDEFVASQMKADSLQSPFVSSTVRIGNRHSGVVDIPALVNCVESS